MSQFRCILLQWLKCVTKCYICVILHRSQNKRVCVCVCVWRLEMRHHTSAPQVTLETRNKATTTPSSAPFRSLKHFSHHQTNRFSHWTQEGSVNDGDGRAQHWSARQRDGRTKHRQQVIYRKTLKEKQETQTNSDALKEAAVSRGH